MKLLDFTPACFTMTLGTGDFAVATLKMAAILPGAYCWVWFLNILNSLVFSPFLAGFFLTWKKVLRVSAEISPLLQAACPIPPVAFRC